MKKITKDDDDKLIVEVSSRWVKGVGFGALFFLGFPLIRFFFHQPLGKERLIGFIGAAITCGVIYLGSYEESLFTFHSGARFLTWKRKRSLLEKEGTLPFDRITQVILQSPIGNSRYYPKARVTLLTRETELPLSIAYEQDEMNQVIAERIRCRLGLSVERLVPDAVQSLIDRGLDLDAVRLLREKEGLSLMEAKNKVVRLKAREKR
ncbi:MAG: hypothetical protein HY282_00225 [Nitrospirae bacterium]|nr:hypothetical protein [Candidatus Manganitrophaceae bacterium]